MKVSCIARQVTEVGDKVEGSGGGSPPAGSRGGAPRAENMTNFALTRIKLVNALHVTAIIPRISSCLVFKN